MNEVHIWWLWIIWRDSRCNSGRNGKQTIYSSNRKNEN